MHQIILDKVCKTFQTSDYVVKAVERADLAVDRGESVAIVGPSGSGKSTLLNILGAILAPDLGRVVVDGQDITGLSDAALCRFRNSHFGYVVQDFALLDGESVYANIRLPLLYSKDIPRKEHSARIRSAATALGIHDKLSRKAGRLSGGERQRAAIARAIVCDQPIILADEPTGSLDAANRDKVMDILTGLCKTGGRTLILVTHDLSVAARCDRTVMIKDGRIIP